MGEYSKNFPQAGPTEKGTSVQRPEGNKGAGPGGGQLRAGVPASTMALRQERVCKLLLKRPTSIFSFVDQTVSVDSTLPMQHQSSLSQHGHETCVSVLIKVYGHSNLNFT